MARGQCFPPETRSKSRGGEGGPFECPCFKERPPLPAEGGKGRASRALPWPAHVDAVGTPSRCALPARLVTSQLLPCGRHPVGLTPTDKLGAQFPPLKAPEQSLSWRQ